MAAAAHLQVCCGGLVCLREKARACVSCHAVDRLDRSALFKPLANSKIGVGRRYSCDPQREGLGWLIRSAPAHRPPILFLYGVACGGDRRLVRISYGAE